MAKKVEMWEATDGKLFQDEVECEEYNVKQAILDDLEACKEFDNDANREILCPVMVTEYILANFTRTKP